MSDFVERHKSVWGDDPRSLLDLYRYHPELTRKLDGLKAENFGRETLNEIVLWKLSRYPYVEPEVLQEMKTVAEIRPGDHEAAREILNRLLRSRGIALPMASTILRFLNPQAFQIIDDRAYRVLFPGKRKYPTKPMTITNRYVDMSIDIYFRYLDELHRVACETFPFESADRILYQLDIQLGNGIGDRADWGFVD
jgi:hypothetical protein